MACGCAGRMRTILRLSRYEQGEDGIWRKDDHEIPDAEIETDHFRVLIETMERRLFGQRVANFQKRLGL